MTEPGAGHDGGVFPPAPQPWPHSPPPGPWYAAPPHPYGPPPGGVFWPPQPEQARYPAAGQPNWSHLPPPTFGPPMWQPPPRRRGRWIAVLTFASVALGAVVCLVVWLVRPAPTPPTPPRVALTELDDGIQIGYPTAPVTIDIFDEPICPACGRFVTSSAADLQRAVAADKLIVRYHLLNFLDQNSASGDYSSRAVAATVCLAETKDAQLFPNFWVDLFASDFQPEERASTDRTDAELAHLSQTVGAPSSVADCITSHRLLDTAKTQAAGAQETLERLGTGVSTPQVYDGTTKVDASAPGWVDGLMKSS